ncbi:MAG TPA: cyclopropane fatty acyl phospholipid synthase [Syntrophales bacterium]|nr:cyclopropane fatty acyl phospholipid synthase [Syntrophales bacterium]
MNTQAKMVEQLFSETGVQINGPNPWDIRVRNERLYSRLLKDGSLGLGESYMEGWWDCSRIDGFICRLLGEKLEAKIRENLHTLLLYLSRRIFNPQSLARAGIIARRHYDLGNELFFSFLDPYNQYSCAYFQGTDDLAEAQQKKLELICRKINLQSQDHILDIGCGWGGFARYAAETYGCTVTAVNISEEQVRYAREFCKNLPVNVHHEDYRQIRGSFDKIISVGMFEHVGQKNYRTFVKIAHRCLKEGGIFLLHTIGGNVSRFSIDPWINRYIFPNGMLPSMAQIARAVEGLFVIEDLHNLSLHYEKTLLAWNDRFQKAWPGLAEKFDRTFKRMWEYYLLSSAGAFRARHIQVWQIVMTKGYGEQPMCRCT